MENKKLIERADLDFLLKYLNRLDGFSPTSIAISERPDFIITSERNTIGVELTRAVYGEIVRAEKLHMSECPNLWIDVTHLKDREARRSNEDILESMTNLSSQWKKTEDSALEWKDKIANALKSKREKYNQSNFQVFGENWLLIRDNPSLPASELWEGRAWRHLNNLFREASGVARDFDTVFIHSGQFLFRWRNQELHLADTELVRHLNLTNLAT